MVKDFKLFNKKISSQNNPFIIAEIGVNHNGNLKIAKKLIDLAKNAKADCVKFQTFDPFNLVSLDAKKAPYQINNTKKKTQTQFEMLSKLKLSYTDHLDLIRHCKKKKINFLSTPYNFEDVDFLDKLNVGVFKLSSMHLSEPCFIEYVAKKKKPIILSTGMSTFDEVKIAVKIVKKYLRNKFILMQCTTNYPAREKDSNINVIKKFKDIFDCHVGYSDHTTNNVSAIAAVALGAVAFEKHFTLNKNLNGPDHRCSLSPSELVEYIRDIIKAKNCLGSYLKKILPIEKKNQKHMKRSIYAKRLIEKGQKIELKDLEFKRPQNGIPSSKANLLLGKKARKKIITNKLLNFKDFF